MVMTRLIPVLSAFAMVAVGIPAGHCDDAPAGIAYHGEAVQRTDRYGDPLPEGAVARLGSARLRHAYLSDFVLLPDGRTVLTAGGDRLVRFWDLATGRPKRVVQLQ